MSKSSKINVANFFKAVKLMGFEIQKHGFKKLGESGVSPYDVIKHFRDVKGFKEKLSKKQLRQWCLSYYKLENYFKPSILTIDDRKKNLKNTLNIYAERMRKNPTKAEELFRRILDEQGYIKYECQKVFRKGNVRRIVDFYFPEGNLAVELDGGYHFTEEQRLMDKQREDELKREFGLNFIRFTNKEVFESANDCFCDAVDHLIYITESKKYYIPTLSISEVEAIIKLN